MASQSDLSPEEERRISYEVLRSYRQVLTVHFLGAVFVVIALAALLLLLESQNQSGKSDGFRPPIVLLVVLAGALGALFSALQRLYKLERLPAALTHPLPGLLDWHLWMYSLIPPVTGMIGAVFFYLLLASGLVEGPMFQHFRCDRPDGNCDSLNGLLSYSPYTVIDYAKSLVWGFVSGLSERLVPDALARLDARENHAGGGSKDA